MNRSLFTSAASIAVLSAGVVAFVAITIYSVHIMNSFVHHQKIVDDLHNRVNAEYNRSSPQYCFGINLNKTETDDITQKNCFDDNEFRFVLMDGKWNIYKISPFSLVAKMSKRKNNKSNIVFYGNQDVVIDFKDTFFANH